MQGSRLNLRWATTALVYVVTSTVAGASVGLSSAALGSFLVPGGLAGPATLVVVAVGVLYGLHELQVIRVPVPSRRWQVQ